MPEKEGYTSLADLENPRPVRIGFILTAGGTPEQPDLIGEHRASVAIHAYNSGKIDTLLVTGGGGYVNPDTTLAQSYHQYFTNLESNDRILVHEDFLRQNYEGVETISDVVAAVKQLAKRPLRTPFEPYSAKQERMDLNILSHMAEFYVFSEREHASEAVAKLNKMGFVAHAWDTIGENEDEIYKEDYFASMEVRRNILTKLKLVDKLVPFESLRERLDLGNRLVAYLAKRQRIPVDKRGLHTTKTT